MRRTPRRGKEPAVDQAKVEEALDEIRPLLRADGGDVELVAVDGNVVKLRLQGHCAGCPMAQLTLQRGIEARLREKFPELERVERA